MSFQSLAGAVDDLRAGNLGDGGGDAAQAPEPLWPVLPGSAELISCHGSCLRCSRCSGDRFCLDSQGEASAPQVTLVLCFSLPIKICAFFSRFAFVQILLHFQFYLCLFAQE